MKKIIIIMVFLLTGCINYTDINNLAIINEITIDYTDKYDINIKVLEEEKSTIYNEKCNKLIECFSNLNNKLTKKIYLNHMDLLILSKNINKNNINEIMNYFLNNNSSRNTFSTIVVNKIDEKLLNTDSKDIISLLELSNTSNGLTSNILFDDLIKDILNYKISYLPYLENNEIKGYISVYDENKIYSKDKSIILNFIFNKITDITLIIDNKEYKITNSNTTIKNENNNLLINISLEYEGNNIEELEKYLNDNIDKFIKNNNLNYFYYLKDKYKIKGILNITKNIDISLVETNTGDYFE